MYFLCCKINHCRTAMDHGTNKGTNHGVKAMVMLGKVRGEIELSKKCTSHRNNNSYDYITEY